MTIGTLVLTTFDLARRDIDILDNLPRLRMSSAQLRFLLFCLRTLGVKNVPSYDAFRAMQKDLHEKCGNSTTGHVSSLGNRFYVNDLRQTVSRVCSVSQYLKGCLY